MKKLILLLSLMCFVFGIQAQNRRQGVRSTTVKKTAVAKRTRTSEVKKIVPMTSEQVTEYTKHMVDSVKMEGSNWESILILPGLTKNEIYRFAKEYMSKTFTNWARNIQIDEVENGKIVCMGALQTIVVKKMNPIDGKNCAEIFNGNTRQTLTLDIKDEKVRVRGEGFAWTGKSTFYIENMSCDPSYYHGEGLLTMSMLIGEDKNVAGGETMCCDALRLGVLQYLTELRNYALKAKLDDDF